MGFKKNIKNITLVLVHSAAILFASTQLTRAQPLSIDWEVTNRYRAFDYLDKSTTASAALFQKYAPQEADDSVEAWQRRLASNGTASPFAEKDGPWNEDDKAKGGSYDEQFLELPETIQVRVSIAGGSSPSGRRCKWTLNGQAILVSGSEPPTTDRDCTDVLTLNVPRSGSEIKVQTDDGTESSVRVEPKLKIIVGLGDSYASGQGNPDRPTQWVKGTDYQDWLPLSHEKINALIKKPARWWSNRCNRSFWSYQNMVALAHAVEDKRNIVSFVHLACSGAEVVDGVLSPQRYSPGHPAACNNQTEWRATISIECDVARSQLRALVDMLCLNPSTPLKNGELENYKKLVRGLFHDPKGPERIVDLAHCPVGKAKSIHAILLSVGGNDIGFGRVVTWGLMPFKARDIPFIRVASTHVMDKAAKEAGIICPKENLEDRRCQGATAVQRIAQLPKRYEALAKALGELLGQDGQTPIFINQYPNPLYDKNGELCSNPHNQDLPNEWYGNRVAIPRYIEQYDGIFTVRRRMQINLTRWEASIVDKYVILSLNEKISETEKNYGWNVVNQENLMAGRGWCTGRNGKLLPPNRAATWKPYADNTRRIRTGNDSFLTQWPGTVREDGSSGTFHPTANAHAATADRVLTAMRDKGAF